MGNIFHVFKNVQKGTLVFLTLILIIFTTNCSSSTAKTSYISSFERFVHSVAEKQDTYTYEDWERADLQFEQFIESDYQKHSRKLTKEENQKIGKLKGKYLAIRAKYEMGNFMNDLNDAIEQFEGMLEGFSEEFDFEKAKDIYNQQNEIQ